MQDYLVRIVRLSFIPERVPDFLALFDARSEAIRSFPGCVRLELVVSEESPSVFKTVSIWRSEADLEAYRDSAFFKETWSATRTMFAEPPEATSYTLVRSVSSAV